VKKEWLALALVSKPSSDGTRMAISCTASGPGSARSLSYFLAAVYRLMPRRIRTRMESAPMLLLTVIGKDSGESETVALGYVKDGPDLVVASNCGRDLHAIC
jgi:F420H(2)-dependent quinone reductase